MLAVDDFRLIDMAWNYVLLIIPFFVCKLMVMAWNKNKFYGLIGKIAGLFLFGLWLLFIPNSIYVIMDIRHLAGVLPAAGLNISPDWNWAIIWLFIYALGGWIAFVYFINQMKDLLQQIFDSALTRYFPLVLMPLTALGVLMGLTERLNSWDAIMTPGLVINTAIKYLSTGIYLKNIFIFTIFLYLLYYLGNYFLVKKKLWTTIK